MLHIELLFIDISSRSSNPPKLTLSKHLAQVQWQCDKKKCVFKINCNAEKYSKRVVLKVEEPRLPQVSLEENF